MPNQEPLQYRIVKRPDGTWQAALMLGTGDSLAAVATGLTKADATIAAARKARAADIAPKRAATVQALAAAAKNPIIRDTLKSAGIEAAKAAASFIPGGGAVVKALDLASKWGPAKRLLGKLF